jgi:hypothetical protein
MCSHHYRSLNSTVSTMNMLQAGQPRICGSTTSRGKRYLFTKTIRLALGSTQLPFQWVQGALSPGALHAECFYDTVLIWPHAKHQMKKSLDHQNSIHQRQNGRYFRLSTHCSGSLHTKKLQMQCFSTLQ